MVPAVQETRIRSLADMARALGRSEELFRLLEIAAEEARLSLNAASVSVSRLEPGTMTVRTIINVGELGPTEERWPDNEVYAMEEFGNLGSSPRSCVPGGVPRRPDERPRPSGLLLRRLGKNCAIGSPIIVDGQLWGEFYATRTAIRRGRSAASTCPTWRR